MRLVTLVIVNVVVLDSTVAWKSSIQISDSPTKCSESEINHARLKCDETYHVSDVKDTTSMRKMCINVESLIQCKTKAVEDCVNQVEFREHLFMFDPEKWKVYYRFTCSNIDAATQLFNGGCIVNDVCNENDLPNPNIHAKDSKVLCRSMEALRSCVSISPDNKTCFAKEAKFMEDIRKIGYSVSICDNTDIKELYNKYGGSYKRGSTSGTAKLNHSFTATSLAILSWIIIR